jgi:hypothetical protein
MQNDSTKSASGAKSAVLIPSKDPSKDNEKSLREKQKVNSENSQKQHQSKSSQKTAADNS